MGFVDKIKKKFSKENDKDTETLDVENVNVKQAISQDTPYKEQEDKILIKPRKKDYNIPTKTVSSVEKNIDNTITNTYGFEATQQNGLISVNSGNNINKYNKLLDGKIKDDKLKKEMISNSEQFIRKRVSGDIYLTGDNEHQKVIITVIGILPEDETEIINFWMDRTIYNDINTHCLEFENYMKEKNILIRQCFPKSGNPMEKTEVKHVRGNITFK